MSTIPQWMRDETRPLGVDWTDPVQADRWERLSASLWNDDASIRRLVTKLGLRAHHTVLDMGAGSGAFAVAAARTCAKVYAVDLSPAMLELAVRRARDAGADNVEFRRASLLTYDHDGPLLDIIVCQATLHHLPDFWKFIALRRMARLLREGGTLYLSDAVYSFSPDNYEQEFQRILRNLERAGGPDLAADAARDFREEFMTLDWIMEVLLLRAGFVIDEASYEGGVAATYRCLKRTR